MASSGYACQELHSGPVVRLCGGRSPRVVLKAAARYCFDACAYRSLDREQSDNYRIAAAVIEFTAAGERTPVEAAYALHDVMCRKHGTGIYSPRVGTVADLQTAANLIQSAKIERGEILPHSPEIPFQVDGRTAREIRASVVAYLEWRLAATCSTRAARLASPYHDALCTVNNPPAAAVAKASTVAAVQFPQAVKIPASSKKAIRA